MSKSLIYFIAPDAVVQEFLTTFGGRVDIVSRRPLFMSSDEPQETPKPTQKTAQETPKPVPIARDLIHLVDKEPTVREPYHHRTAPDLIMESLSNGKVKPLPEIIKYVRKYGRQRANSIRSSCAVLVNVGKISRVYVGYYQIVKGATI